MGKTRTLVFDAIVLGGKHGRNAASWRFDGNTPEEEYVRCIALDKDGDPAWEDEFGARSPLSGEFADDMTPQKLFEELNHPKIHLEETRDAVCTAYEKAYYEVYKAALLMIARRHVGSTDDYLENDETEVTDL